jgi:hypothetical protein
MLKTLVHQAHEIIITEEYVLSGAHQCNYNLQDNTIFLIQMTWIFATAWEVLTLCLAIWMAVKQIRERQRPSTGWVVGDCFTILMKTHVFYFLR